MAFTEEGCSNCPPTQEANWARLEQEVVTVQASSTTLPPPLRLKARGAGAARPKSTACLPGSTALRSSRPWSRSLDPEDGRAVLFLW